jgi:hypothetical protein
VLSMLDEAPLASGREPSPSAGGQSARLSREAMSWKTQWVAAQARQLSGSRAMIAIALGLRQDRRELQNVSLGMHGLHVSRCGGTR